MKARVTGHFGEWLQGRMGPDGAVALVTLTCPVLGVEVDIADGALDIVSDVPVLDTARLIRFLEALGVPVRGRFTLRTGMIPGAGAGASTAVLVAIARAVLGPEAKPGRVAAACLAAEGASDPLMLAHPDRAIWASRQAKALITTGPLPKAEIVGGFWGDPLRTDPGDADFPDISDLIDAWQTAVRGGDLAKMARLSARSARRTTGRRGPVGDPVEQVAHDLGALGFARAHTGSARAVIFAPGAVPRQAGAVASEAGLTGVIRFRTGGRA